MLPGRIDEIWKDPLGKTRSRRPYLVFRQKADFPSSLGAEISSRVPGRLSANKRKGLAENPIVNECEREVPNDAERSFDYSRSAASHAMVLQSW